MAADRAGRIIRRLAVVALLVVVVAVAAGAAVQWFRPVPQPDLVGVATRFHIPGTPPSLPWPASGEAAVAIPGFADTVQVHGTQPAPIAGLAGVLTAYVVLKDHPLATGGETGPKIAVTPEVLAAEQAGHAAGQPEVAVTPGETLTELDALEGLLVASGNDMAILLADWDAGTTTAFVAKMQNAASTLGLVDTHVTDPSGADPATVSTPSDLIRLGEAVMRVPVLSQIVSLGQTTLPGSGVRYNPNFDLGRDGIVGIGTGSDTPSDGAFLFAARRTVNGEVVTLYGAVLGQSGPRGPDTAAVEVGDALVRAVMPAVTAAPVMSAGRVVGVLAAPWGASAPVAVSGPVTVVGWPGLDVPLRVEVSGLKTPVARGERVGVLTVRQGSSSTRVSLSTTSALRGPSRMWRLTR